MAHLCDLRFLPDWQLNLGFSWPVAPVAPGSRYERENVIVSNPCFSDEALSAGAAERVYG
jgi:hypothetical protein